MDNRKIKKFMQLAGQKLSVDPSIADDRIRILGAQLLLSEVLEYVIRGLGVKLSLGSEKLDHPEKLHYHIDGSTVDKKEMLDGLADTAYTMYWNMVAFGLKLEEAFDLVCDNNLEKFVLLDGWQRGEISLSREEWGLGKNISWPVEVTEVHVIKVGSEYYGVGKDKNGKVRKPSTYKSVDLSSLLGN